MKKVLFLISILLIGCISVMSVHAAGMKEDRISQAKELIKEKKYNEALVLLSRVIQEEPERFDEAVQLTNKIKAIREKYNEKLRELITTLYDDQDVTKGLILISELEELDPNPNQETQEAMELAREGASVVANLNLFETIMEKARALLDQREFIQAIKEYSTGFSKPPPLDLHKKEYEQAGFDQIIKDDLSKTYSSLTAMIDSIINKGATLSAEIDALLTAVSFLKDDTDVPSAAGVINTLIALSDNDKTIQADAQFIRISNERLRERTSAGKAIIYLKYSYQLIMGRESFSNTEGISYAAGTLIRTLSSGVGDTYLKESRLFFDRAKSLYDSGKLKEAGILFGKSAAVLSEILGLSYFMDKAEKLPPDYQLASQGGWLIHESLPYFMEIQEQVKETLAYISLIGLVPDTESITRLDTVPTEIQYDEYVKKLDPVKNRILAISSDWKSYLEERREKAGKNFNTSRSESVIAMCAEKASSFISEEVNLLVLMFEKLKTLTDAEVSLLRNGTLHNQYGVVFYPDTRAREFNKQKGSLAFISAKLEKLLADISSGTVTENNPLKTIRENADNLRRRAADLAVLIDTSLQTATDNILQAKKNKDLGNLRLDEAQKAVNKQDYKLATMKISEAETAFRKSLTYREDEEIRQKSQQLLRLSRKIEEDQNAQVIKEVRRYIEQGKDYYSKGLYEEAQRSFLTAESRWAETKEEENPEISDWLAYVLAALTIESARIIPETDPLYKEMSQLFNLAKEDYNNGIKLLKAGKKTEAMAMLENAESKLIIITKQFPYNNDARLLKLYILKEKDEQGFRQMFSERIADARKKIRGSNQERQEAYNDLKDLALIDPNYPGLSALIVEFEYAMGIRRKLPTTAEKDESKALTEKARPYILNRQFDYFPLAKELLTKALKLDPDNQEAKNLYDKMGVEAGSDKKIVLAAGAMREYERAEQMYLNGQYIEAYNIIRNLLNDPANTGYEPIRELEKRLKIALGMS